MGIPSATVSFVPGALSPSRGRRNPGAPVVHWQRRSAGRGATGRQRYRRIKAGCKGDEEPAEIEGAKVLEKLADPIEELPGVILELHGASKPLDEEVSQEFPDRFRLLVGRMEVDVPESAQQKVCVEADTSEQEELKEPGRRAEAPGDRPRARTSGSGRGARLGPAPAKVSHPQSERQSQPQKKSDHRDQKRLLEEDQQGEPCVERGMEPAPFEKLHRPVNLVLSRYIASEQRGARVDPPLPEALHQTEKVRSEATRERRTGEWSSNEPLRPARHWRGPGISSSKQSGTRQFRGQILRLLGSEKEEPVEEGCDEQEPEGPVRLTA